MRKHSQRTFSRAARSRARVGEHALGPISNISPTPNISRAVCGTDAAAAARILHLLGAAARTPKPTRSFFKDHQGDNTWLLTPPQWHFRRSLLLHGIHLLLHLHILQLHVLFIQLHLQLLNHCLVFSELLLRPELLLQERLALLLTDQCVRK